MIKILKGVSKFILETLPQVLATVIAGVLLSMYHGHTYTKQDLLGLDSAKEEAVATAVPEKDAGAAQQPADGKDPQSELVAARPGDAAQPEAATAPPVPAAAGSQSPGPKAKSGDKSGDGNLARATAASPRPAGRTRTHQASLAARDAPSGPSVSTVPVPSYPLEPNLAPRAEPVSPVSGTPPGVPSPVTPGAGMAAMPPFATPMPSIPPQPVPPGPVPPAPVGPSPAAAGDPPPHVLGLAVPGPVAAIGSALDPRPVIRAGERAFARIGDAAGSMVPDFHRNSADSR